MTAPTHKVRNWDRFQHYRNRCPPWIKLHRSLLDDADYAACPAASAKLLPLIWLVASEDHGRLPDVRRLAFRLRVSEQVARAALSDLEPWIEQPEQDASMVLAPRTQDACLEGEGEGERETEEERDARKRAPRKRGLTTDAQVPQWLRESPGWSDALWADWMATRRRKRASNSEHAIALLIRKLEERPDDAIKAIETALEAGWTGFEWTWFDDRRRVRQSNGGGNGGGGYQRRLTVWEEMAEMERKQKEEEASAYRERVEAGEADGQGEQEA